MQLHRHCFTRSGLIITEMRLFHYTAKQKQHKKQTIISHKKLLAKKKRSVSYNARVKAEIISACHEQSHE